MRIKMNKLSDLLTFNLVGDKPADILINIRISLILECQKTFQKTPNNIWQIIKLVIVKMRLLLEVVD